ncbi:YdeI/OmpD-associated family protein [Aquimarina sp. 2201CG5-10]|uniref:YdeI/OmpD-associated family protein n=1 Tax=Aquimarina callyspongiae TaxID=3098150 RepID=UPI002AB3E125|nr:YdeI/OmpD-associated family protein [Aquimarina sp. 2201CG5-10]MDY8135571.1 YdeI/OmpD-associated family protein [Aquimarina sp. 2201CG5-10]
MEKNKSVEEYISKRGEWIPALEILRSIMRSTEMKETVKWGVPVYTVNGKNVIGIGAFKSYLGIWFYQGVFLKDSSKKLINAQEGKTKGLRQWRFTSIDEIDKDLILQYVNEAIQNQKEGKEIKIEKSKGFDIPTELQTALNTNTDLKASFEKLTPFKQKEYAEYITTAKREATRVSRLEKITPMIFEGIGLNDKYR